MALPVLPYREPEIINSCTELGKILKKEKSSSVLVVTDKGIVNNGLLMPIEDVLNTGNIPYAVYDDTLPNPTVKNVEDALSAV
jgi:alcohol dehydrogenase class IV